MNFHALPTPMLHPHTTAPIDLDRLERVNLETSMPRQRGRTTAFVVHMVGCALVAQDKQQWVYIADSLKGTHYAHNMFLDMLHYEHLSPVTSNNRAQGLVEVATEGRGTAAFYFKSIETLDPFIRGRIIQDYYLDVCNDKLHNFNNRNPGVLMALHTRLELSYDQRA